MPGYWIDAGVLIVGVGFSVWISYPWLVDKIVRKIL